jgi:SAM-dependent methyltransferase
MKERLLQYLACPACQGKVFVHDIVDQDGHEIMEGELRCSGCDRAFPIVRGVPRFAAVGEMEAEKAATAFSFGWQWQHFTHHDDRYGEQMLGWLNPVRPEFFHDKVVLDGGCGKGRHTTLAAAWGAREVIGIDLSDAVDTAFAATRDSPNIHIVQGDICRLPFGQVFDYAFTIGVLIVLGNPVDGFNSLAAKIKPGGHLSVWVYGAENNGWIMSLINPLRVRFTSRMNPRLLMHLSKIPTAVLFGATKLIYGPLKRIGAKSIASRLFYGDYLTFISDFGWREHHTIVFDHLVAPTAHYVKRAEFEQWWEGIRARDTIIGWHNRNSWRGLGQVNNFQNETEGSGLVNEVRE